MNSHSMKRVLFSTLFFSLSACSSPKDGWSSRRIDTSAYASCAHLSLPSKNPFRNLSVTFQKDVGVINVYLNVYCTPFERDSEGNVAVFIFVDQEEFRFNTPLLAGNQRLLLTQGAKDLLLNALNAKKDVIIKAGKYTAEVHHEAFEKEFDKFNSP